MKKLLELLSDFTDTDLFLALIRIPIAIIGVLILFVCLFYWGISDYIRKKIGLQST